MNILNIVDGIHLGGLHIVPRRNSPGYWQMELDDLNIVKGKRSLLVVKRLELGIPLEGLGEEISTTGMEKSPEETGDEAQGEVSETVPATEPDITESVTLPKAGGEISESRREESRLEEPPEAEEIGRAHV